MTSEPGALACGATQACGATRWASRECGASNRAYARRVECAHPKSTDKEKANMNQHPAFAENRVAVITGAASGIGLAAAQRFAAMGMRVCLADLGASALDQAA